MSEWQPIETAPKDGTPVMGYWIGEGSGPVDARNYALTIFEVGSWRGAEHWDEEYGDPDFWMPLPPPPTGAQHHE